MDTENRWDNLMQSDWLFSKTYKYLSIHDLSSLRAVNRYLNGAIDSFLDMLPGNILSIIGLRAFSILASYLSMDDVSNLNLVSNGCRFSARAYSTFLPEDVRRLVSSWCDKNSSAILMYNLQCFQEERPELVLYHPPFLKVSLGPMAFDKDSMKLKGLPLQEIHVNNVPPLNLGRTKPFVCTANDAGNVLFYCGGESFVEGFHGEHWLSPMHLNHAATTTTGIFDTMTGLWRQLPSMPEPRSGGVACRIGRRVYIFGGMGTMLYIMEATLSNRPASEFMLVFDLDEECWIPNPGIDDCRGGYDENECQAAVAVDSETAIIIRRQQVLALNTTQREWTQLTPLPMRVGTVIACEIIRHPTLTGPTLIVVGKKSWAKLVLPISIGRGVHGTWWEVEPDLRGFGLKVMRFHKNTVQVFSGNTWEWMESDDITRPSYYGGRLLITRSNHGPAIGFVQCTLK
eukprot:CCRYP_001866-RA/>CCRYP_001866-RA protein AED:0.00 eAED:0.00 QI:0/-1/0/1/-1/1/1/21/456